MKTTTTQSQIDNQITQALKKLHKFTFDTKSCDPKYNAQKKPLGPNALRRR